LAPFGTFEGKIPQAALDLIASRTAAIKDGSYVVEINDAEPTSS
ncbi:MAG: BMP family ABC transporter substrate-binding protein, partial [Pseudomonadota bacterium]|nr:BMP family ABC transporter substrate-binding protein [Pseudomonadota bacterium]